MIKKVVAVVLILCLITSCTIPDTSISDETADPPKINRAKRNAVPPATYILKYPIAPAFLDDDTLVYFTQSKVHPDKLKVFIYDFKTGKIKNTLLAIYESDIYHDIYIDVSYEILILGMSTGVLKYYSSELVNTKTGTLQNKNIYIDRTLGNYYISPDKSTIAYSLKKENKVIVEDLENNEILSAQTYLIGEENHTSTRQIPINKNFCIQITKKTGLITVQETTRLINLLTEQTELEYTEPISTRKVKGALFLGAANIFHRITADGLYDDYSNAVGPNFADCVLLKPTPAGDIDIEFINAPAGFEKSNVIVGENSEFILYIVDPGEDYEADYSGPAFALRDPDGNISCFDLPENTDNAEFYNFIYHSLSFLTLSPTGLRLANDTEDSIKIYDFETGEFTEIQFLRDKSPWEDFPEEPWLYPRDCYDIPGAMIDIVGNERFNTWLDQTPRVERHIFSFLNFFEFTYDDYRRETDAELADYVLSFAPKETKKNPGWA